MKNTKQPSAEARRFLERLSEPLTFRSWIRAIRLGEELSLAQFAERLGVSRTYLCSIEQGRRRPSVKRAAEWGRLLGYGEAQFVRLVLQDELDAAKVKLRVSVAA
ncbi:MAG: helix-turn-helix transcriptional regulator [Polyangiaceae bacterium]|nr:helix-turn-helix transcriptional regulator [Polyangiaceae bacterium]